MNMHKKKINHRKYGKYIIASNKDKQKLEKLFQAKNEVEIFKATKEEVLEKNKDLNLVEAIFSPNSGVIDVPELAQP